MHGVNLDALDRRPAEHYGGLTFSRLEQQIEQFARELGLEPRFFHTNHEGEYVEELHKAADYADGAAAQPRRVDALRVVAARRGRARGAARRRGPSLRRQAPRAVPGGLGARGRLRRQRQRAGRRRLPRRARAAQGGAVSRADRVAARLAERELDLLLVDRPRQPALPHRLHRHQRAGDRRARHAPLPDRLPLRRARQGGGRRSSTCRPRRRSCARRWPTAGRRGRCASASRTSTSPCGGTPSCARRCPTASSWSRAAGSSRPSARSRSRASSRRSAPPPRSWTRSTRGCSSAGWSGRTEREVALALEQEMRVAAPTSRASPRSSPRRRTARCRTRRPRDVAIPARHAGHARHRGARRRLLLRLHAHVGDRASSPTTSPRSTTPCSRRRRRRSTPSGRARRDARSTPSRAT